jgi:hypothetical protein
MLGNVGRGLKSWRSGGTGTKCRDTTHNCNDKRPLHEAGACCSGCTSCNRNCPLKPCIVRFVPFPISYLYVARIPSFTKIGTTFYQQLSTPVLLHIDPTLPLTRMRERRYPPNIIDIILTSKTNHLRKPTPQSSKSRFTPLTITLPNPTMSFKSLLTTLLLAATTTITTTATPLTKRNLGGVRLCDQPNWGGNCWYGIVPLNTCMALNSL